ncbi:MAG: hypothetical protein WBM41_07595 [Arenicellales bacterium]
MRINTLSIISKTFLALIVSGYSAYALAQASLLFDGDFESGTFQGWTPSGENGGFAQVVSKGSCYSSNDTTAISFNGNPTSNFVALLRSNAAGNTESVGKLRSNPFTAGNGVIFSALSETLDGDPGHKPVNLVVNILDSEGNAVSDQPYNTAVIKLAQGCPSVKRDAAFSRHFIDTHHLAGQEISIEFSQNTKNESMGYFTLIDNVLFVDSGQFLLSTSQPIAVAGTGLTTSGTFFLDPRASIDPDDGPVALSYSWFIDGEDSVRHIDIPCVNLNEDFLLSPGNNKATLYANDGFNYAADSIRFVIPESDSSSTTNNNSDNTDQLNADDTDANTDDEDNNNDTDNISGVTLTDPLEECDVDVSEVIVDDGEDSGDGSGTDGNSPPVITVGGTDGEVPVVDFSISGGPVSIASNVTISDADGDNMESATVSIQNPGTVDRLLADSIGGFIVSGSGGTSVTIANSDQDNPASNEAFAAAIETIEFDYIVPAGDDPDTSNRTITYTVNDGVDTSEEAESLVDVAL